MTEAIAAWDWEREPVPEARVVVCRPGLFDGDDVERKKKQHTVCFPIPLGERAVVASMRRPEGGWMPGITPALYAERQADLAEVPELLNVKAERHALVLCPREAIDIARAGALGCTCPDEGRCSGGCPFYRSFQAGSEKKRVDLVVIIPPPEACPCPGRGAPTDPKRHFCCVRPCGGIGAPNCWVCSQCNGSGRIEPWPMHPAWVRGIVEQCRAASVPVCFLGWGPWRPRDYRIDGDIPTDPVIRLGENGKDCHWLDNMVGAGEEIYMQRVGVERSGRLVDGAEVQVIPAWLS